MAYTLHCIRYLVSRVIYVWMANYLRSVCFVSSCELFRQHELLKQINCWDQLTGRSTTALILTNDVLRHPRRPATSVKLRRCALCTASATRTPQRRSKTWSAAPQRSIRCFYYSAGAKQSEWRHIVLKGPWAKLVGKPWFSHPFTKWKFFSKISDLPYVSFSAFLVIKSASNSESRQRKMLN